jgi:predicted flap endonuclease-1-like 5' DNA nuclease
VTTLLVLAAVAAAVAIGFAIGFVIGGAQHRGQRRAPDATPASPPLMDASPAAAQSTAHEAERRRLEGELAQARAETARYRALIVDIENNAPSPLMGPGAPDDLKLIVGVGPVLERMLHQLGVTTFRQVAYWSERDIDEFDAKLHEFPGRIRRDGWVTQARALHQSKYGEALPIREPK